MALDKRSASDSQAALLRDDRFFAQPLPHTLAILSKLALFDVPFENGKHVIQDVATLEKAQKHHITFFENRKYLSLLKQTQAGACLVRPQDQKHLPSHTIPLVSHEPYRSYALVTQALYPTLASYGHDEGIHTTAHIHPTARLEAGCRVGAYAVIGEKVCIGAETWVGPHVVIERGCQIGQHCRIENHASLAYCVMGDRVHVHAGARIGQTGFGFHIGSQGFTMIPHLGRVIIHDDVRIGANTTLDRGSLEDTVIERSTMIDNLVQIGHNVSLGHHCVLAGQAGVAGSTTLGSGCVLGGQSGVIGHLKVGQGTRVAVKSIVMKDTEPGSAVGGMPAMPLRDWQRWVALKKRWLKSQHILSPSIRTEEPV